MVNEKADTIVRPFGRANELYSSWTVKMDTRKQKSIVGNYDRHLNLDAGN
jgi:hypothetical protein